MSDPTPSLQQARQRAQEDIQDIDALASSQPFNRYWVRKLNARYADEVEASLTSKTVEEREQARSQALALRALTQLPASDRKSCENFLRTPDHQQRGPVQVG